MVVLRSQKSIPVRSPSTTLGTDSVAEPATPFKIREHSVLQPSPPTPCVASLQRPSNSVDCISRSDAVATGRRRSLRLASKSGPIHDVIPDGGGWKIDDSSDLRSSEGEMVKNYRNEVAVSVTDAVKIDVDQMGFGSTDAAPALVREKRKLDYMGNEKIGGFLQLRSGAKVAKKGINGVFSDDIRSREAGNAVGSDCGRGVEGCVDIEADSTVGVYGRGDVVLQESAKESVQEVVRLKDGKSKGILIEEGLKERSFAAVKADCVNGKGQAKGERRFSKQEKGKEKLVEASAPEEQEPMEVDLKPEVKTLSDNVALQDERQSTNGVVIVTEPLPKSNHKERFRKAAKNSAYKFAHFVPEKEESNATSMSNREEAGKRKEEIEDWPGPFSTALKIIRDRAMNLNGNNQSSSKNKESVPIRWFPRPKEDGERAKRKVPSLEELSMKILSKNVDAVISLESVPDELRNKLSCELCVSRKMSSRFLELLFAGSPTEVRVNDCSWLEEDDFSKIFDRCNASNLMVLQLDQCGRCMADYILQTTLARPSFSLPSMTTISLKGACRLSDIGLRALVCAAPALKSINLSQCSLLTSTSIEILADHLGSSLMELYIDDCQSIDAMHILSALNSLENLEVLSLAGIQTVCDDFIKRLTAKHGQRLKKLVLADCVNLTDSSMKAISETCSELCALELVNLSRLTDSAIGHLAIGCPAIQTMKFRRNNFSDEAVAAYLESSGEVLVELSLNNVRKVGNNTALSLAKHAHRMVTLDLSWCRRLSDEAMGLIVDNCSSLRVLKLFGCSQITSVFREGHRNTQVEVVGLMLDPLLESVWRP